MRAGEIHRRRIVQNCHRGYLALQERVSGSLSLTELLSRVDTVRGRDASLIEKSPMIEREREHLAIWTPPSRSGATSGARRRDGGSADESPSGSHGRVGDLLFGSGPLGGGVLSVPDLHYAPQHCGDRHSQDRTEDTGHHGSCGQCDQYHERV